MLLRVVDIETTGMDPAEGAEIIELGWQDVRTGSGAHNLMDEDRGSQLFAPQRACPPEVMAVHHILPWHLERKPRYSTEYALDVMGHLGDDVLDAGPADVYVAHNAKFESLFLGDLDGKPWLCTYKAALRVWPHAPAHNNQTLLYWLGLHKEIDEERRHPPHRAEPDAYVTAHILTKLLQQASVEDMLAWTKEPPVTLKCPIGKWRGKLWTEVEASYLRWMIGTSDMDPDLKWNAQRELDRRRAEQGAGRG